MIVDEILDRVSDPEDRRCGYVHLYGVSLTATWLARLRGANEELAACAGMLHDISSYRTGDPADHAARSAADAEQVLESVGSFTPEEIGSLCTAIRHHSDKRATHDPFSELLKDADVLQHLLYNPELPPPAHHTARRASCLREILGAGEAEGPPLSAR